MVLDNLYFFINNYLNGILDNLQVLLGFPDVS